MSDTDHSNDLPGVVHKTVGPSRTAAYAIIAATDPILPPATDELRATMKQRLLASHRMLSRDLAERVKAGRNKLPEEVEVLRRAAADAIAALLAHPAISAPDRALGQEARLELATVIAPAVEQSTTAFLSAFDTWARETDDAGHFARRRKIVEASDDIGKISRAINMISINASIEASRAGEAGRGFAIIANEIRGLSEKTQASLEKIMSALDEAGMGER